MQPNVCKNCNKLQCYIIDDTMSFDKKPYVILRFHCFNEKQGIFFENEKKIKEIFYLKNGKWKRQKNKKSSLFSSVSIKQIEKEMKLIPPEKTCPYYIEHQLFDWNF